MRSRILLAGAMAAGLAVTLLSGFSAGAQAAAPGCTAAYTTANFWQGGFVGAVKVTAGSEAIKEWKVTLTIPAGAAITSLWNGAQSGSTVSNVSWNGNLSAGGTAEFGFQGTGSPTGIGVASCTAGGTTTTPTTTPVTPTTTRVAPTSTPVTPTTTRVPPTTAPVTPTTTATQPAGTAPALHVSGNKLVTSTGATYRLLGVNRSGGEFACIQAGGGMWNGPMDQASVTAMKAWKVRTVRVPLNEECWLGTSSVPAGGYKGAQYQSAVKDYVNLLLSNGITPLVEMHWNYGQYTGPSSGCSAVIASCQKPMPDAQYAPQFWTSVANTFKDTRVVFDLFNEPYPERATGDATSGWKCWRDGGTCPGIGYQVAGFQSLVNAVRGTGNTNVILLGGLAYSNDISQWLTYKPTDPTGNLAAFAHVYNFNSCISESCWNSQWAPVAAQVPLTISEIGENDCGHSFIDRVMTWADGKGVGYLGWTWNNWDCSTGPSLISDYNGTPTNFGAGFKAHLSAV